MFAFFFYKNYVSLKHLTREELLKNLGSLLDRVLWKKRTLQIVFLLSPLDIPLSFRTAVQTVR